MVEPVPNLIILGTFAAGLRADKPTIIVPFFGDQYLWADRVVKLKAGIKILHFNSKSVTKALVNIFQPIYLKNARELGKVIRDEDGVNNAINVVYFELARIRRNTLTISNDLTQVESETIYESESNIMNATNELVGNYEDVIEQKHDYDTLISDYNAFLVANVIDGDE
jgi:hypothetical protein